MSEILNFIAELDQGVTEDQLSHKFSSLSKLEIVNQLNQLIKANEIEIINEHGKILYKAIQNKTADYEAMVLAILAKTGSSGLWLRDIKTKTNIPHNLILKILRNLEVNRKIKSIKSVKNNRKIYILYDIKPDEDVTGGVWFNNNDVDLIFVNKLQDVIYRFCYKKEESFVLNKIDSLVRMSDLIEFISSSKISEIPLSPSDINTLVDCLVFDGRMEKYEIDDGIALRVLSDSYLKY